MKRVALLIGTLACLSCASAAFDTTWTSPDAKPLNLRGRKVVAVFVSRDPLMRRLAEDAMAREITTRGAEGVAAYTFLSDTEIRDPETARQKAEERGFSAAAVMRVVGHETQYTRVTPNAAIWADPPYRRIWGDYWRWGWGTVGSPAYLVEERIVKIETLIYSLEDDQLVWAGVSRTFEPMEIQHFVTDMAAAVSEELAKEGLTRG